MSVDCQEGAPVSVLRAPKPVELVDVGSLPGCVRGCSHHTVALSLPDRVSPSVFRARLAGIMRHSPYAEAWDDEPVADSHATYFDSVSTASTTPQGRARLLREMGRCLPDDCGIVLRSLTLSFSDLDVVVLTASGSVLDRAALEKTARLVCSDEDLEELLTAVWWDLPQRPQPGSETAVARPEPAVPGRRCWELPLADAYAEPPKTDAHILDIAAIAHAIARHQSAESVSIGVVEGCDLSSVILGATQPTRRLEIESLPQDTVGDLLLRVEQALSRPGADEAEPLHALVTYPSSNGTAYFPGTRRETPYVFALGSGLDAGPPLVYSISGTDGPDDEATRHLLRDVATVHRCLATADPTTPLAALEFLSLDEVSATLACADGGPIPEIDRAISQAVVRAAREHPEKVAVSFEDEHLTYRELDELSARVAAGLRRMGVRRGEPVGVCVRRSPEMIGLLLGILRSGSAYVPVDIGYPAQRIIFTCQDADVRLLIADETVLSDLGDLPAVTPVSLLDAAEGADACGAEQESDLDDLAYVIYTSGSTGTPKGVGVTHRNVMSLIESTSARMGFTADDVWTQFHSVTFDFSVWEIWACLCNGGRLVVVPHFTARSPEQFLELLLSEGVTVLNQTPTAFGELTHALNDFVSGDGRAEFAERCRVRLVVFGGEALDPRVLDHWFRLLPRGRCEFVNMYGITETTVHVTAQRLDRSAALEGSRTVGRAIPGWRISVRDPLGRLLPPGIPGEIHVGGAGVATGYLDRPRLTAERFVHDRYASAALAGSRVYRSGDVGVLRPDGSLDYRGRLDSQVKVRGYRIELNEIRSALCGIAGVRDAAVKVTRESASDARIDAYLVLEDPAAGNDRLITDVRTQAHSVLPGHMIPGTWTLLDRLPLTGNGKLDLGRLPAPTPPTLPSARDESGAVPIPTTAALPGTTGEQLRSAWRDVFGYDVPPDVSFFDNGGTSLLALRLVRLLRDRTEISLTIQEIYRHPTISQLAAHLARSAAPVAS